MAGFLWDTIPFQVCMFAWIVSTYPNTCVQVASEVPLESYLNPYHKTQTTKFVTKNRRQNDGKSPQMHHQIPYHRTLKLRLETDRGCLLVPPLDRHSFLLCIGWFRICDCFLFIGCLLFIACILPIDWLWFTVASCSSIVSCSLSVRLLFTVSCSLTVACSITTSCSITVSCSRSLS